MTEILRFEMNVPAEVALKHAGPGKPIEGRYGNRVMYTLADDRVMYVAPIVASRIIDLGIQPGEVFQVCKQLKKQGSRRLVEWQVERLESESDTQLESKLRESLEIAQTAKVARPPATDEELDPPPVPLVQEQIGSPSAGEAPAIVPVSSGLSNGNVPIARNGNTDSAVAKGKNVEIDLAPAASPTEVSMANSSPNQSASSGQRNGNYRPPVTTKLEHALKTAISAAYNAEKYSAELGYVVRFDADAIKSMAITVLINMSEGSRR